MYNATPWIIPTETRMRMLLSEHGRGKKIHVVIYEIPDTSTFRYRAYNMFQMTQLNEKSKWKVFYFYLNELSSVEGVLDKIAIIALCRVRWSFTVNNFIYRVKQKKIPVLFDVDDFVVDLSRVPEIMNDLNVQGIEEDYTYWFSYVGRLQKTASMVDGFTTTNDFLGNLLSEQFEKSYVVIPNFPNKEQIDISKINYREIKKTFKRRDFVIGYFSGTPSHANDFKLIADELLFLLDKYQEMVLQIVGFMEFPSYMESYIQKGRIRFHPLVDFLELQVLISQVDVNIVPLVETVFTDCKSELKYFEASLTRVPTVASPTYAYKKAISHGNNGFLCQPGEWADTITEIYQSQKLSQKITENALQHTYQNYTGTAIQNIIETGLSSFDKCGEVDN